MVIPIPAINPSITIYCHEPVAKLILHLGENLKALEVAEEKAQQREEEYKKQVLFAGG